MNVYKPTNAWQRTALAAAGSVTSLSVLASAALLFADRDDRLWIAAAIGLPPPAAACGGRAPPAPGCPMLPAVVARAAPQPQAAASVSRYADPVEAVLP